MRGPGAIGRGARSGLLATLGSDCSGRRGARRGSASRTGPGMARAIGRTRNRRANRRDPSRVPRPDAASCVQPRLARGADGRPHLARGADAGALDDADGRPPFERGADAGALRGPAHAQGGAPLGAQRVAARGAPVAGEHASREASEDGGTFALPSLACALARHRHHHHQVPSSVLVGTNIQSCYHWIHIPAPAEEQPDTVAIVFTRVDDLHLWRSSEERCARPSEPVITRVAPAGP